MFINISTQNESFIFILLYDVLSKSNIDHFFQNAVYFSLRRTFKIRMKFETCSALSLIMVFLSNPDWYVLVREVKRHTMHNGQSQ